MTAALKIPHLGFMDEVRVDEAFKCVAGRKDVTMLCVLIKAASLALEDYPDLNATVDAEVTELRINHEHNLGIAMDTPRGLLVPVIADVRSKSVFDIAKELNRLKELGAAGKLGMQELSGGTFSLSNIGSVGGTYASPVIMPPQVAIGAFGRAKRVPVFESPHSLVVKEARVMPISWSADHRVIDGATVAKFSNRFKALVENPVDMLLRMH
jgi:2-oxoisovalerate dehydrogenase E2 component (dihydrolipoyl transacylase)